MEIRDIIRSEVDRLFIVDPECYIVFTGETTDDLKPFIRIGNWRDMPVGLIPLIENIIITDSLIGDPAHEQFNIDVRHLGENRYIGEEGIVNRFLEYQKIFGLDLTNASVVDIKKDLPELSSEKNISHKDQFIGVFYRDGNFKILLDKRVIFDLHGITAGPTGWRQFNDLLCESYGRGGRYGGSGLFVAGRNPVFHHKGRFYPYLFPDGYFGDFAQLGVNPGKIEAVLFPSLNLTSLTKLLKWVHGTGRAIRVFSNNEDLEPVRRLFSRGRITIEKFSGLEYHAGSGLEITNYPGTFNVRVRFGEPGAGFVVPFIKGPAGAREILREKADLFLISYTAFEEIAMLLRSTATPFAVIDDGNRNVAKLAGWGRLVLSPGRHYEFRRCRDSGELIALSGLDGETAALLLDNPEALEGHLSDDMDADPVRWCNTVSLARAFLHVTGDRRLSARLKRLVEAPSLELSSRMMRLDPARYTIILALDNGGVFPFVAPVVGAGDLRLFDSIVPVDDSGEWSPGHREARARIIEDRARLQKLIDLYSESGPYRDRVLPDLGALGDAIEARKRRCGEERLSLDSPQAGAPATDPATSHRDHSPAARPSATRRRLMIAIPAAIILIITAAFLLRTGTPDLGKLIRHDRTGSVESRELDERYRDLGKRLGIRIRDHDILRYANSVALANGYHKIRDTGMKEGNPDWIYPDNVFVMLDGERVTVSRGDTLWNLSRNKLIESALIFDDVMTRLGDAGYHELPVLIIRALAHATSEERVGRLSRALEAMKAGGA
ncbi:MAG: hypothetical protein JW838_09650 [Spirochaetes bacterium]|nr:hypothetical protein [Spirochaetota bacterium]